MLKCSRKDGEIDHCLEYVVWFYERRSLFRLVSFLLEALRNVLLFYRGGQRTYVVTPPDVSTMDKGKLYS